MLQDVNIIINIYLIYMGANGTENAALWGVNVIDGQWFERGKSVKMPWKSGLSVGLSVAFGRS